MDMRKLVTATIVAGVTLFVVDLVLDLVPFIGGHHPHGHHEHEDLSVWGALGSLFHGLVLAVVLGWRGVSDAKDGAIGGATYGALLSVTHSVEAGNINAELVGAVIGIGILMGAAGAAIALAGGSSSD